MLKINHYLPLCLLFCFLQFSSFAQLNWRKIEMPSQARVKQSFLQPETAYANTVTWGWDGPMNETVINRDLDSLYHRGFRAVTIEAGYRMPALYLSDGWFKLIKIAVETAKKKGMRVWIIDEGKYPSGFAGGKFSQERPDLRMQGLIVAERIKVADGQAVDKKLSSHTVSAVALNLADSSNKIIDISSGSLHWPATKGNWQITVVQHQFKTAVTRAANNPTGGKDTTNSLCDYLNPVAVKQFIDFTHEQYKKYIGDEFGKTVLGFRGDEPDFAYMPWTTNMPQEFSKRKGYAIQPYIASFFLAKPSQEQKKAKADYWDVWSDLFGEHFFKLQADWCAANNLEYMVHLNHDHEMIGLVKSEGDFFKNFRSVQIPGIDVIWNQVWPGKITDFPKFASSAAHLNGRSRALSESFAAFTPPANIEQARWIVNQQLVRGINLFEFMFFGSTSEGKGGARAYMADPSFPSLMAYANRASYLLSLGRPAARIAVYFPTTSLWLGHNAAEKSTFEIAQVLLENQHDFDFIDDYSLSHFEGTEKGQIKNKSGQVYTTVIVPDVITVSKTVMDRLKIFVKNGGKVIFTGSKTVQTWDRSFLKSAEPDSLNWAISFSGDGPSAAWLKILPVSDLETDQAAAPLKYLHRKWADADAYFIFNESNEVLKRKVTLKAQGALKSWDLQNGEITPVKSVKQTGRVTFNLELPPYGTTLIVGDNK